MTAKRRLYLIYFCLFASHLIIPVHSNSQQLRYNFKNYTPSDGLPSSEVYQVMQDASHYMWFATDHGVCRYNGYAFETFNLPDNSILGLYEDGKKRIWAYSFSGQLFYYQNGKFEVYKWNDKVIKAIKPGVITGIYVDSVENLFVSASGPSNIMISEKGVVTNKFRQESVPEFLLFQITGHEFYTSITAYPSRFNNRDINENKTKLAVFLKAHKLNIIIPHLVLPERCRLKLFSNGEMIFYSRDCIVRISKNGDYQLQKTSFTVEDIEEIEGNYYLVTGNGLVIQDKNGKTLNTYFNGLHITSVEKDYEGGLWFSSITKGVFYLNNSSIKHLAKNNAIVDKRVKVLLKLDDSTFLGGVDPNEIIKCSINKSYESIFLQMKSIFSFYHFKPSFILVGGTLVNDNVDVWKYNPVIRKSGISFLRLQNSSDFVENNNILYSGIHDRIFEFDKSNLNNLPNYSKDVFRVSKLFLTSRNEILVGNQFGLWKYKDGHIAAYDSSSSFLKSRITDIAEYRQKYLCLGTRGNGLLLMQNSSIYQISDTSGLVSNNIRRIFIDDDHIWLATNQGISIVTIKSEKPLLYSIRNISVQDGLLSNEVNDMFSNGNEMIVATNSGISFLDKNVLFKKETYKLPFYITDIKLNGTPIDSRQLKSLSYRKRNLSVSFEALNFSNPGKNNYRYRLLGFDTSWLYTNDLKVQINPLPYGNYQLQMQAKREFDSWGQPDDGMRLPIRCSPPFWTTGWFFAIILAVVSFLFFLFYKQRIRLVKKRQEEKEDLQRRIAETEQMALKSQMNPHFIFNSLNSIQQYVIEGDVEGANSFISGFSKLIRQTLEFSSKERITLDEEISYLKNYLQLEKNKMEDIFRYEVTIQTKQSLTDISIPPLLLQPYVENAVRHGVRSLKNKEGIIHLFFIERDDVLECRIEDNGIGRERALQLKSRNPIEYQSKGMSLTANRVELLNKTMDRSIQIIVDDLRNQANDASGTRVTVLFPV